MAFILTQTVQEFFSPFHITKVPINLKRRLHWGEELSDTADPWRDPKVQKDPVVEEAEAEALSHSEPCPSTATAPERTFRTSPTYSCCYTTDTATTSLVSIQSSDELGQST